MSSEGAPKSAIYIGTVMHARRSPVRHRFRYPVYVYVLDLDELPDLDRDIPRFGYNRKRLVSIHDADYLSWEPGGLREKVLRLLRQQGISGVTRIVSMTSARVMNYVFNPVTFHFCYSVAGPQPAAVVAEVNNTFGEKHAYVLSEPLKPKPGFVVSYRATKRFHVSPFFPVDGEYEFHFADLREKLDVLIHYRRDDRPVFAARLTGGERRALTRANLRRTLLRFPLRAVLTMPRILWQAVRLHYQRGLPVYPKPLPTSDMTLRGVPGGPVRRLMARAVLNVLGRVEKGCLTVRMPDLTELHFGEPASADRATLVIHRWRFFKRAARAGETGFGEAYVAGDWDSPDLTNLLRFLVRNRRSGESAHLLTNWVARWFDALRHAFRPNSLRGSRRNIQDHYDLSNEFFERLLDTTWSYSCALFEAPGQPLENAQRAKLRRIIELARIGPDDHVLEIGCGWGGFAIEAARGTGCRVTGITISQEQHDYAVKRVRDAGLQDRIGIQLCDYRHLKGRFDRIVSIEMLEAVGHRNLPDFFAACDRVLKPNGLLVLQVITMPDHRYDCYRRQSDWIRKHIFPGGHLPSLTALCSAMARRTPFMVESLDNIGPHYAPTLRAWRDRLPEGAQTMNAAVPTSDFFRTWTYYFSYCEAAFAERYLNDLHLVVTRPQNHTLAPPAPHRNTPEPAPSEEEKSDV